jgi:hypothetical protein
MGLSNYTRSEESTSSIQFTTRQRHGVDDEGSQPSRPSIEFSPRWKSTIQGDSFTAQSLYIDKASNSSTTDVEEGRMKTVSNLPWRAMTRALTSSFSTLQNASNLHKITYWLLIYRHLEL